MSDSIAYWLHRDGQVHGPYSREQIDDLVSRSLCMKSDLLFCEQIGQWQPASHVVPSAFAHQAKTVVEESEENNGTCTLSVSLRWLSGGAKNFAIAGIAFAIVRHHRGIPAHPFHYGLIAAFFLLSGLLRLFAYAIDQEVSAATHED